MRRGIVVLSSLLVLGLCIFEPTALAQETVAEKGAEEAKPSARVIEIIARNFEFEPDVIRVQVGETIKFVVTSEDIYHTFTVKASKDAEEDMFNLDVYPGQPVSGEFTFTEAGALYLYCIPHEGLGMVGEIQVIEPGPAWMEVELTDSITGEKFKISDFRGRPILLESFAVWCSTCLRQQKEMDRLKTTEGDTIIHISLNTDPNESQEKIIEHVERHGFDWRFAVSPVELTKALLDEFGARIVSAPTSPVVLICPDLSFKLLRSGVKSAQEMLATINEECQSDR